MGVPVVTKLGNGIPSRLGGAILSAVGLTDWVADGDDQYVEIALRASADQLRKIRHELPEMINRRCSPAAYTRAVEEAIERCGRRAAAKSKASASADSTVATIEQLAFGRLRHSGDEMTVRAAPAGMRAG